MPSLQFDHSGDFTMLSYYVCTAVRLGVIVITAPQVPRSAPQSSGVESREWAHNSLLVYI